jgi:hypothetical protein
VYAEHFTVDDGCKNEEIKHMTAGFPDRGIAVLLLALLVKAVDLCDLSRFMVSSDEDDSVRVSARFCCQ